MAEQGSAHPAEPVIQDAPVVDAGTDHTDAADEIHAVEPPVEARAEEHHTDDVEYVEEKVIVMRRGAFFGLIGAAALLALALAGANVYQMRKANPSVATVNGTSISRKDYDKAVASSNGEQVLGDLVSTRLVEQDAAHKHVTVSTEEVDAQLKQAKQQLGSGDAYKQALASNHLTELQLRDRIRLNLLLQKLVADKIQVSDDDIQKAYDAGKDTTYQGKSLDEVKDQIKTQLTQQKQQDATASYLDDLRNKGKVTTHVPGA